MLQIFDFRQMKMQRDDRAALIGATGTGKTTLARYLVEDKNKKCSVVYNNKPSDSISLWQDTQTIYQDFSLLEEAEEDRLIYTPPLRESLSEELQDRFFAWIYERRYTRLYIDEASALRGGSNPSYYLQACLARGRERGISTITGTQRPSRVPLILLSESEHFYIFRLTLLQDRMRIYEMTGISVDEQTDLRNHEFFYFNAIIGERSPKLKLNLTVTPQNGINNQLSKRSNNYAAASLTSLPI